MASSQIYKNQIFKSKNPGKNYEGAVETITIREERSTARDPIENETKVEPGAISLKKLLKVFPTRSNLKVYVGPQLLRADDSRVASLASTSGPTLALF